MAGIQRYLNVLKQLERNLEQPPRMVVEDTIKTMRETLKIQENYTQRAERMIDKLSDKVHKSQPS